ncbi:MAG: alpha/beta fold hydrolase [Gammaproteobacteria bacterium]
MGADKQAHVLFIADPLVNHGQSAFRPSAELFPFRSRWFNSNVGPVHYVDEGTGPVLVLLHGNAVWSFAYRHMITLLRNDFRCIAVDYPGFGLSVRPSEYGYTPAEHANIVVALMQQLALDEVTIFGEGYGGPIGLMAALNAPERVRGLVMANTWFWPTDWFFNRLIGSLMCVPWLKRWSMEQNFFVERILPRGVSRPIEDDVMAHYRGVQASTDARRGIAELSCQLVAGRPWLAELQRQVMAKLISKPLLLVWGGRDPAFPAGHCVPRWRAAFTYCTFLDLPQSRHFVQEDEPGRICDAFRTWHQTLGANPGNIDRSKRGSVYESR